jgi:hypothetical protein
MISLHIKLKTRKNTEGHQSMLISLSLYVIATNDTSEYVSNIDSYQIKLLKNVKNRRSPINFLYLLFYTTSSVKIWSSVSDALKRA